MSPRRLNKTIIAHFIVSILKKIINHKTYKTISTIVALSYLQSNSVLYTVGNYLFHLSGVINAHH
jgi:hypothetical protein